MEYTDFWYSRLNGVKQKKMTSTLLCIQNNEKVLQSCTQNVDYNDILEEKLSDVFSDLMHETMQLYTMQNDVQLLLEQTQDKKAISLYKKLSEWNGSQFNPIREKSTANIHSSGVKNGKMIINTKYPHGILNGVDVVVKDTGTLFDGIYKVETLKQSSNTLVLDDLSGYQELKKGIVFTNANPLKKITAMYKRVHEIYQYALIWHKWLSENDKEEVFEDLFCLCDELVENCPPTMKEK